MAIEKRFIHFKKFSDFNSKKLSANEANTQYTVGISGEIQTGSPDVLYQSYVWIKDTQQQWTHGQIYNGSDVDIDSSQYLSKDDVDVELSETSINPVQNKAVAGALTEIVGLLDATLSSVGERFDSKQDAISDLDTIRSGAEKGATAVQPNDISEFITVEDVAKVATSGSYNDLVDKPTIPSAVTESTVSGWGFTKNTGTITGVSANGTSIATSGVANIPAATTSKYGVTKLSSATNSTSTSLAATASAVKSAYDLANGRQEKLVSGTNIKTINNTSILGSGNIAIDANIQAVDTSETLDEVNTNTYVKYVAQTLTEEQKAQVRENIGVSDAGGSTSKPIIVMEVNDTGLNFSGVNHMIPNVIYVATSPIEIISLEDAMFGDDLWYGIQYNSGEVYAEYTAVFISNENCSFSLPSYILWSNGTVPEIESGVAYELSISLVLINSTPVGRAVLVPFKSASIN